MLISEYKNRNYIVYFYIVFIIVSNLSFINDNFGIFKYIKYAPLLFTFSVLKGIKINNVNPQIYPFVILIISSLIRINQITNQTLYDVIFYITGILLFTKNTYLKFNVKYCLVISAILSIFYFFLEGIASNLNLYTLFIDKSDEAAASIAYIFTFLCIIFAIEKKHYLTLISFIFLVLFLKRLNIITVITCIMLIYSSNKIKEIILNPKIMIILNLIFVFFTISISNGEYSDFILEQTGISIGKLTSGRTSLYSFVLNESGILNNLSWLVGTGEGSTVNILKNNFGGIYLLHNDILKIFIEHGIFVLIIFTYYLFRKGNQEQKMITFAYNLLLFADNTIIYLFATVLYLASWSYFGKQINNRNI